MASIGDIIGQLEHVKTELDAAQKSATAAERNADEMVTQVTGMELEDAAKELRVLNTQIETASAQIALLVSDVDALIATAETLRHASHGSPDAEPSAVASIVDVGPPDSGARQTGSGDSWASPDSSPASSNTSQSPRPAKHSDADLEVYKKQGENIKAPGWRSRILAKKSAAMTVVVVGGVSTAVSSITPLPGPIQAAVTSFLTVVGAWHTHKENTKDDET